MATTLNVPGTYPTISAAVIAAASGGTILVACRRSIHRSSGTTKLDLTALHTDAACVLIQSDAQSTSLYVEKTPGVFNASIS